MKTSSKPISFGTSGHRGIIGESFTADHVTAIAKAVADLMAQTPDIKRLAVGYDSREGNSPTLEAGSFTQIVCDTLIQNGIDVDVFDSYVPTPVVSWYIQQNKLNGGFILTASHNPGEYNGIKFNTSTGAPAPSEVTRAIESLANAYFGKTIPSASIRKGTLKKVNCNLAFVKNMIQNIQLYTKLPLLNLADIPVVIDAKHGTVAAVWRTIFSVLGLSNYQILNADPLSDFGGIEPNPTKLASLDGLRAQQAAQKAPIAIANDPDGDRHVILDENGDWITPEEITVIIMDYLLKKKGRLSGIASTVASSGIVKEAVSQNSLQYDETAVGFKNFAPFLEASQQNQKIGLAVESSGGFTASFHTLEKCGFLPALFLLVIIKDTGESLSQLKIDIQRKYGQYCFLEEEYHFPAEKKSGLSTLFNDFSDVTARQFTDKPIVAIVKVDGVKLVFSNGWLLIRLSGTEPLARIYAESPNKEVAVELIRLGKTILST